MKVDHISILVRKMDEATQRFSKIFGNPGPIIDVREQEVQVCFFELENTKIELVCPYLENKSLQKRLNNHGEGVHHIAIDGISFDIQNNMNFLPVPSSGANGKNVKFLPPNEFCGTLFEFIN